MRTTITLEDYTIKGIELYVEFQPIIDRDEIWDWWGNFDGYGMPYIQDVEIETVELNGKELKLSDRNTKRISEYIQSNYEDEIFSNLMGNWRI